MYHYQVGKLLSEMEEKLVKQRMVGLVDKETNVKFRVTVPVLIYAALSLTLHLLVEAKWRRCHERMPTFIAPCEMT